MEAKVIINTSLVDKLKSISQDIKTYVNMNAMIYESWCQVPGNTKKFMDDNTMSKEDVEELLDIRKRIKVLTRKLEK